MIRVSGIGWAPLTALDAAEPNAGQQQATPGSAPGSHRI